jgi:uncharacterized repeat protein (TIGR01451 family)
VGLADGADDAFVIHVTLASTIDGGTILANSATVSATGTSDPDATNDASNVVSTTVIEDVQLTVVKAFASATITAGGPTGTFTVTVTNSGASDADNLVVTDVVDSRLTVDSIAAGPFDCSASSGQSLDCSLAHLAAGASQSLTVTYHVVAAVADATVLNQADATSDEDSSTGTDSVDVITAADLLASKSGPASAMAGGMLTYTITVSNLGPSDALSVTLIDILDASLTGATYCLDLGSGCGASSPWTGSVNLGTLPAGASVDVVISATVDPATPDGTIIANAAIAGTTTSDPNSLNNASSTLAQVTNNGPAPTPTPTPTPTATPTSTPAASGSLANTSLSALGGPISPLMLLAVFSAWVLLLGALAAESAWRRRSRG